MAVKGIESTKVIPVIKFTAKGEEPDIIVGIKMGADDYITRPFSLKILNVRVNHAEAKRAGWVFTRQQIVDATKGHVYYAVTLRAIDVHIFGLRKKLGELGTRIEAVRSIGYRFND